MARGRGRGRPGHPGRLRGGPLRRGLDALYAAALGLAAGALAAIAALVAAQIAGRALDRALLALGRDALGLRVSSLAEIGGFLFVGAAFLALPATLRAAGHVRVTVLARALPPGPARALTALVLLAAFALAGFATWHAGAQALDSWRFGSVSFGVVPVPLWLPQGVMTAGLALLAVALADELAAALRGADPAFLRAEAARGSGEG